METYRVTITRTEEIAFEVEAHSPADAESRFLSEGDEVGSATLDITVNSTERAES